MRNLRNGTRFLRQALKNTYLKYNCIKSAVNKNTLNKFNLMAHVFLNVSAPFIQNNISYIFQLQSGLITHQSTYYCTTTRVKKLGKGTYYTVKMLNGKNSFQKRDSTMRNLCNVTRSFFAFCWWQVFLCNSIRLLINYEKLERFCKRYFVLE